MPKSKNVELLSIDQTPDFGEVIVKCNSLPATVFLQEMLNAEGCKLDSIKKIDHTKYYMSFSHQASSFEKMAESAAKIASL